MRAITISKLKNIPSLHFELPEPGVWLLTGENGCGKTTLLAAIRRIGYSNAFATHFAVSNASDVLDDFTQSEIKYTFGNRSVSYSRSGVRWVPFPKRNADILNSFNYPSVEFIGANADRITPREDDFVPNRIRHLPQEIIESANDIFSTDRFNNLRIVNVTRGPNPAYVFVHGVGQNRRYCSERNFSIGELCVLKLLKKLRDCPDNSLFLVDELEMALHPSAQVKLLRHLQNISIDKNLTIIFSTHSVTLIKSADRKNIIFLRKGEGVVEVIKAPYPSIVLGALASVEERSADIVVYVEDDLAESVAEPLLSGIASAKLGADTYAFPKIAIVPIGGFREVINFLKRHDALHRPTIVSYAMLDADVKEEAVSSWQRSNNYEMLAWIERNQHRVLYMPWTPEVGLFDLWSVDPVRFRDQIRIALQDQTLHLPNWNGPKIGELNGPDKRRASKRWVQELMQSITQQTAKDIIVVRKALGAMLAKSYIDNEKKDALMRYGRVLS